MAIQDIGPVPEHKYTVQAWREGEGDPRLSVEVRTVSNHDSSLVPVGSLAELIRSAFANATDIETVEVRQQTFSASDTVVPAP